MEWRRAKGPKGAELNRAAAVIAGNKIKMANTAQMKLPDVNKLHYYMTKRAMSALAMLRFIEIVFVVASIASETDSDGVQPKEKRARDRHD